MTAIDPDKLRACLQVLAEVESLPPEHPDAVGPVQHRHEQPDAAVGLPDLAGPVGAEGGAGGAVVDRLGDPGQPRALQRPEHGVLEVLQVDGDVAAAHGDDLLGDQRTDQPRGHQVGPVQQGSEDPLTEALGAGPAVGVGEPDPGQRAVGPARRVRRARVVLRHPSPTTCGRDAATRRLSPAGDRVGKDRRCRMPHDLRVLGYRPVGSGAPDQGIGSTQDDGVGRGVTRG